MRLFKNHHCIILSAVILLNCLFTVLSAKAAEPLIRVGLIANQSELKLRSAVQMDIVDAISGKLLVRIKPDDEQKLVYSSQGWSLNGKSIAGETLRIRPLPMKNGEQAVMINKKNYRGEIELTRGKGKGKFNVINVLPMEQYLYGIISCEISPSWPREAVKAQAVAARTYAMHNMNKHEQEGYDVCASTDCQVYGGKNVESPDGNAAVDATRGEVLLYKGQPIAAYFHGSSGGYTENGENVWGGSAPYIRGVVDYDQNSPYYQWEKNISSKLFAAKMKSAGYLSGNLTGIQLSDLPDKRPLAQFKNTDRGVSGRVKTLALITDRGRKEIGGNQVRSILGLNSTLFDIKIIEAGGKTAESKETTLHRISAGQEQTIVFSGHGWGHGLGLSQWGAKAMAERAEADAGFYKTILRHYYFGVEIKKKY